MRCLAGGALLILGLGVAGLASPAPGPARPEAEAEARVSVVLVGDVMFGRYAGAPEHRAFGLDRPFRHVSTLLRGRDVVVCNLETPITARPLRPPTSGILFRAEPAAARVLREAGFTVAITANNHANDQGAAGVRETLGHLARAGVAAVGSGATAEAAWTPHVVERAGLRVGILAATLLTNYPLEPRGGAVSHVAHVGYATAERVLARHVRALRPRVDFVLVSVHLGKEYRQPVIPYERRLVQRLLDAGADVVLGHHPHILRAVERRRSGRVAFYSLGDFLFDTAPSGSSETALVELELVRSGQRREIRGVRLHPIHRGADRLPAPMPSPVPGAAVARLRGRLLRLGAGLPGRAQLAPCGAALCLE